MSSRDVLLGSARPAAFLVLLASAASPAPAGDLELAVQAGRSLPFYKQSFALNPDDLVPPDVVTSGGFDLELGGGLTVSGALTWRFSDSFGLEARVDSAKVELEVTGGRVDVNLGGLIPGLPSIPVSGDLAAESEIDRLTPVSVNLQFRTGEKVQLVISGGASYMPATTIAATVSVELGASLPGLPSFTLPPIGVSAAATLESGLGGNLGVGLRVPVGSHVSLVIDARGWGFPTRKLAWGPGGGESSPIEEAIAAALDPIEFRYGFFQVAGGLALTF